MGGLWCYKCWFLFQSYGERKKKSQEEDSQSLFESQEVVFQKIIEAFSQSSHSTNLGDLEENFLQGLGSCTVDGNLEETGSISKYSLRRRTGRQPRSATSQGETVSRRPKHKAKKRGVESDSLSQNSSGQADFGEYSQQSVSMLQDCYQHSSLANEFPEVIEKCSETENVINIYSDEETDSDAEHLVSPTKRSVEKATQTESPFAQPGAVHPREAEMAKHASFINSVIKLKTYLSSKDDGTPRDLQYDSSGDVGVVGTVPRETVGYVFRSFQAENVFRETVQALLLNLEDALKENFSKVAFFWKNSVYEKAVEMLRQAADGEIAVRKMIETFVFGVIESILNNEQKLKNLMLESKSMFVVSFCQSTHLSFAAINYIMGRLEIVKAIRRNAEQGCWENKLSSVHATKHSYYILRTLESLLEVFKEKLEGGKLEEVVARKSEVRNYNVLEMWKRHWNRSDEPPEEGEEHEWAIAVSKWCEALDDVSLHCVNHVPVLLMAVGRCGELAKEISRIGHPKIMESGRGVASGGRSPANEYEDLEMDCF